MNDLPIRDTLQQWCEEAKEPMFATVDYKTHMIYLHTSSPHCYIGRLRTLFKKYEQLLEGWTVTISEYTYVFFPETSLNDIIIQ